MLTEQEKKEIRELCNFATPGPWTYFPKRKYNEHHVGVPAYGTDMNLKMDLFPDGCPSGEADAKFIAHAREIVPKLLNALDESRVERDKYRDAVKGAEVIYKVASDRIKELEAERDQYKEQLKLSRK